MKIGIIGLGFVGNAVRNAYQSLDVSLVLNDHTKGFYSSYEDLRNCDGIFICVPSPALETGECDSSILKDVLKNLSKTNSVIISKVTAPPRIYTELHSLYPNLVYVPEFLVAATADHDYVNGSFSFIGGNTPWTSKAKDIITMGQKQLQDIKCCSIEEAALAKYTINSFLATKVAFMNQISEFSKSIGVNYLNLVNLLLSEKRLGNSHMHVPGPDGQKGFGGACLPKDVSALIFEAKQTNNNFSILENILLYNNIIRNNSGTI